MHAPNTLLIVYQNDSFWSNDGKKEIIDGAVDNLYTSKESGDKNYYFHQLKGIRTA